MNLHSYKSLFNYRFFLSLSLLLIISLFLLANTRDQLGDVNNDGQIDVQDIVFVVDIILNDDVEYGEYELWASDVNEDENTDIGDIVIIVDWILDPPEIFECPENYSSCLDDTTECCLDTTSHFFTWEVDTIGGGVVRDISIIDTNDVWAVGQFVMSLEWDDRYNIAHWDGEDWEFIRHIPPPYVGFNQYYSIFTFGANDIWIGMNVPIHFDGSEWTVYQSDGGWDFDGWIQSIWGASPSNVYFVGDNGSVAHYNGEDFELIESGTEIDLVDIDGTDDGDHVFVVGFTLSGNMQVLGHSTVLEIVGGEVSTLYYSTSVEPSENSYGLVTSTVVLGDTVYFSTSAGLWKYNYLTETSIVLPTEVTNLEENAGRKMVGNTTNDIMILDYHFDFIHFNGNSWFHDQPLVEMFGSDLLFSRSIDMKGDFVVSLGYCCGYKSTFVRGYRE